MPTWKQCELKSQQATMVCWLSDERIKKGARVTLKEIPNVTWTIATVYTTTLREPPRKFWTVGGLA